MRRAVIIDVVRSPFGRGRPGGALVGLHPVDLYSQVLESLVRRTGIDPLLVEDVITGCVLQVGEQAGNVGRQAVLAAGFPESVPAVTLDRKCGSTQQAIDFAAQGVVAGAYDVVIAGGVEMMSLVPMRSNRAGKDNEGSRFKARYPDGMVHQGVSAELIAAGWEISRVELDAFAVASHRKAAAGEDAGTTTVAIEPMQVPTATGARVVSRDEGVRRDTTIEQLAHLQPAFRSIEASKRFPELEWQVTAGNSSQVTDGAAAILIAEESTAVRFGLRPRLAVSAYAVAGCDPVLALTAIMPATRKVLARAGLSIGDIGVFEVNEAFASVVLAWIKELGVEPERVNPYGGAIALGHPVGASGGRLLANLIVGLEATKERWGLQTMCESGGMANATLFERL